jgi:hypothetical protein
MSIFAGKFITTELKFGNKDMLEIIDLFLSKIRKGPEGWN